MKLHVERWGVGYAVFEGRKRVSGVYNCRDRAMTRLENIEAEEAHDVLHGGGPLEVHRARDTDALPMVHHDGET